MKVPCFGVHRDKDGVPWLLQGTGLPVNTYGLVSQDFVVALPGRKCNHQINLVMGQYKVHANFYVGKGSLVEKMLPLPRNDSGVFWVDERDEVVELLSILSRLSSPIMPIVVPIWMYQSKQELYAALQTSNIQPLVLTGVRSGDIGLLRDLGRTCADTPRRLILTGNTNGYLPPGIVQIPWTRVPTSSIWNGDNWEDVGAGFLYEWMSK